VKCEKYRNITAKMTKSRRRGRSRAAPPNLKQWFPLWENSVTVSSWSSIFWVADEKGMWALRFFREWGIVSVLTGSSLFSCGRGHG
jgi:hypothetical protein